MDPRSWPQVKWLRGGASPKSGCMAPAIVNDRIAGTRITVWDVLYYLEKG